MQEKHQIRQLTDQISETIECLSERDTKKGLQLVSKLVDQGVDMKYFIEQLISELHQMLLAEVGAIEISNIKYQKSNMSVEQIKELVELLTRAYGELKYAVLPQLPLELAIIQWQALESITHLSSRPSPAKRGAWRDLPHQSLGAGDSSTSPASRDSLGMTNKGHEQLWQELINRVKLYNHSIAGVLRGCGLKSYDNKKIVIETGYKFHKERLEEKKTREIIEKVSREIVGEPVAVTVILKIKN